MHHLLQHLERFLDEAEHAWERGNESLDLVPTGLAELDRCIGGLEPGLHAIVGAPGSGTTAVAHQLVSTASLGHGRSSALVTLGDTAVRHVERLVARLTAIPVTVLRAGDLTADDWFFLSTAVAHLAGAPLELVEAFSAQLPNPTDVVRPLTCAQGVVVYDSIDRLPHPPDLLPLRANAVGAGLAVVIVVRSTHLSPAATSLCDTILYLDCDDTGPYLLPTIHRRHASALPRLPVALRPGAWDLVDVTPHARPSDGTHNCPSENARTSRRERLRAQR